MTGRITPPATAALAGRGAFQASAPGSQPCAARRSPDSAARKANGDHFPYSARKSGACWLSLATTEAFGERSCPCLLLSLSCYHTSSGSEWTEL